MGGFSKPARAKLEGLIPAAAVDELERTVEARRLNLELEADPLRPLRFRQRWELADIRTAAVRLRSVLQTARTDRARLELMFELYRSGFDGAPLEEYVRQSEEQAPVVPRASGRDERMQLDFDATVRQSNDHEAHGLPPTEFLQRFQWNLACLVRVLDGMLGERPAIGRAAEIVRPLLALSVKETLARHGIQATTASDGVFQRVLEIVLLEAATRAPEDARAASPLLPEGARASTKATLDGR